MSSSPRASRSALDEALQRASTRRAASPAGRQDSKTVVFFGSKGGAGTTTLAVNFAVDVARLRKRPTLIVDLKQGLGEVTLFLGVRSRYTLLDALDNMHRLDSEFMRELVVKHKSGVEILAGSDLFDRPSSNDTTGLDELFRLPELLVGLPRGPGRLGNAMRLLEIAGRRGGNLPAFVRWLERQIALDVDESEAAVFSEEDEAVRLLTIHASKGLAFPTTIVVDLGSVERPRSPYSTRRSDW